MRDGNPLLLASILLCTGTVDLQGCVSAPQCASEDCKNDAKITADVQARLKEYRELGAPNSVYVQTRGGVVYLTGQVATDLQRHTAEQAARQAPGVTDVVDSIALTYGGR